MIRNDIEKAPSLQDFLTEIETEEKGKEIHVIDAYDLNMIQNGKLQINDEQVSGEFTISETADKDLADLVEIPFSYIMQLNCDDLELKSTNVNQRLHKKIAEKMNLRVTIQNDIVDKIQNDTFARLSRIDIVSTLAESVPRDVDHNLLKVLTYHNNGTFDISIIAPQLKSFPVPGDEIAYGISLIENYDGGIQVGGAIYRCVCRNGAITRECTAHQERIRRTINRENGSRDLLKRIGTQAIKAWDQWQINAEGLKKLAEQHKTESEIKGMIERLRLRPYFLNARIARDVMGKVLNSSDGLSLYILWNALTEIGTHQQILSDNRALSERYQYRMRLSAGTLARSEVHVCEKCHQLVWTHNERLNTIGN